MFEATAKRASREPLRQLDGRGLADPSKWLRAVRLDSRDPGDAGLQMRHRALPEEMDGGVPLAFDLASLTPGAP